jgi:hypothetical protein
MLNRILNFVGWLGMLLVFAAVGIRFGLPAKEQYAYYLAWAGLVCMALYIASQWREIVGYFKTRQARYGTLAAFSIPASGGIRPSRPGTNFANIKLGSPRRAKSLRALPAHCCPSVLKAQRARTTRCPHHRPARNHA